MSWVCGYCGTENVNDDRVGREEPLCRKCKKERIDPNGLQKKRDEEIKEIEQELKRVNGVIDDISCEIEDLESEICNLKMRRNDLCEERKGYKEELEPLMERIFFEKPDKSELAAADRKQKKLIEAM